MEKKGRNKDKEIITLSCAVCGDIAQLTYGTYKRKKRMNLDILCDTCRLNHMRITLSNTMASKSDLDRLETNQKKSNAAKKYYQNATDEELNLKAKSIANGLNDISPERRLEINKKISTNAIERINKMSDETLMNHMQKMWHGNIIWREFLKIHPDVALAHYGKISNAIKLYYSNLTENEKREIYNKASESQKRYWDNIPSIVKSKRCESLKKSRNKWYSSLSNEEKHNLLAPMLMGYRYWFDNLSDDEKTEINNQKSVRSHTYWNNMTQESYDEWSKKRAEGFNTYLGQLGINPNKNESDLTEILDLMGIKFVYGYVNKHKHHKFSELFPNNPITHSKLVSPFRLWDFIIYKDTSNILVDIDGSIHDYSRTNYDVTLFNGTISRLNDIITFNDSKRPYQTDGLDAYVIQCYDDNLTNDTPVLNIKTNEIISFKNFIHKLKI